MRLSTRGFLLIAAFVTVLTAGSCVSTPPAKDATAERVEKPSKFKYTRIAFGERLNKLLADGKYDQAIAFFEVVPEPDASSVAIRMLKLSVLISAGKAEESATLANELEAANPQDPEILYIQAVLAGTRKELKKRAEYLGKVLSIQPNHGRALSELGMDYLTQRNYPKAKATLIKAIAAEPDNAEALFALSRTYYMVQELDKARSTLDLAITKHPTYSLLWAERARVRAETSENLGAIEDAKKAIELSPEVYSFRTDLGSYYMASGKQPEARAAYGEAIKLDPTQYLAYIYRAGLNDDLGNVDEAISDYAKVCEIYPAYYYAFESLGVLLWGKGEYERSGEAFEQALRRNPKTASYALMRTLCLYQLGKVNEAREFMGKYITTLDRTKDDYFLCRLFVDRSGDAEVINRIMKETNLNVRNRMLFYSAMYYNLFQSKSVAQKYLIEITSQQAPSFFEFRLSKWALRDIDAKAADGSTDSQG